MNEIGMITDFQRDALKEVGNIGIGNATTSLSKMMNRTVHNSLPELELIPIIKLTDMVKGEDPAVGVIQELKGDVKGYILLLLSQEASKLLIRLVLGTPQENVAFNEMEESFLIEIGSIMSGSYITSLSNFLGISPGLSPPYYAHDMANAIINQIVGILSQDISHILLLKTEFTIGSQKFDGKIIIFMNPSSLSMVLEAIRRIVR